MRTFEVTTYREGKVHWTDIDLVIDDSEPTGVNYELSVVGCTSVEGEWEMVKNRTCHTPDEVVEALRDKQGRLSIPAMELLRKAGIDAGSGT